MDPVRIEFDAVTYRIGRTRVFDGLDLDFATGELTVLLGSSGSGKTSILRLAAGLAAPSGGEIRYGGRRGVPRGAVKVALQDDPLYTNLDVGDNLGFPLDVRRTDPELRDREVSDVARRMGVGGLLRRSSEALSSGERAAVAVGRTLIETGQRFLLLDEPLARADGRRRQAFVLRTRRLLDEDPGRGVVIATNDPSDVWRTADRVVVIDGGRVLQQGAVGEVMEHPADVSVARLVGDPPMNLFPATVEPDGAVMIGSDRLRPGGPAPGSTADRAVLVGVWPGDLQPAPPGTPFDRTLHVTVAGVDPVGGTIHFGLGGHAVPAYVAATRHPIRVSSGDRLELTWRIGRHRLFSAATGRAIPE